MVGTVRTAIGDVKKLFGKLLYPQRCSFCDNVIRLDEKVCKSCLENKNEITGEACLFCGCKKNDCTCGSRKSYYKAIAAPFYYDGSAGIAVRNLKFRGITSVADTLSSAMADCLAKRFSGYWFDVITFVPMTETAVKQRGFNQAELLARGVSGLTDIPFSDMLVKTIETKQQHNLKEFERSGNVLGAFDIKEECLPLLKGARVLLCDDVKTTGSTLNECAKTLLISGAEEVMCLTACIAQRENAEKPRGTEVRFVNEF